MKASQWRILLTVGAVFIVLIIIIAMLLQFLGQRYQNRIEEIKIPEQNDQVIEVKRRVIRRVIIRNQGDKGCVEVNPDGVIRVYSDCEGKKLAATEREVDTKFIRQLFEHYTQSEREEEKAVRTNGYLVTVITDSGEVVYYLPYTEGSGSDVPGVFPDTISEIIEKIIEDAPQPTVTPTYMAPVTNTPVSPSGLPTHSPTPNLIISPTPTPTAAPRPFSCDFSENDPKKPYRVSQVVCTSEPTPAP